MSDIIASMTLLPAALLLASCFAQSEAPPYSLQCFTQERAEAQRTYERALIEHASAARAGATHALLASTPHIAGTPGDLRVIKAITAVFQEAGLDAEQHWIWPYLPEHKSSELEILAPERLALSVLEPPTDADPDTAHPDLPPGFNAYSGSGEVQGRVVYANYGRKEDFETLRAAGVDVRGAIVIARYGGNYRGFKAKFAELAGAAGLVMYADPADMGYMRGIMYPEGGWFNENQIHRGSLPTLEYSGDPLTPGVEATEHAERLDPARVDLPTIPVQPVSWATAQQILERMTGDGLPDQSWQGALPLAYRVTGGEALRLRIKVDQPRNLTRTANVIGTLRGSKFPDEWIVIGCHHDAWGFGASDPLAGMIVLTETARAMGEEARRGLRPERTVVFAAWAAEEHGIIGSSEWVEANIDTLRAGGIAYFNLDMAAMGPLFNASASPMLATLIADATRDAPQARDPQRTVFDEWTTRHRAIKNNASPFDLSTIVGTLGGGSDHVGFLFHAGVPSASIGGGGSRGTSWHSNYDTIRWYRKVVGDDYEPALMLARVLSVAVARLARADILPYDPTAIAPAVSRHLDDLTKRASDRSLTLDFAPARSALERLRIASGAWRPSPSSDDASNAATNRALRAVERAWFVEEGLPGRVWHRNAFMAPDRDSGYSSWPLPLLRGAIEDADQPAAHRAIDDLAHRLDSMVPLLQIGR